MCAYDGWACSIEVQLEFLDQLMKVFSFRYSKIQGTLKTYSGKVFHYFTEYTSHWEFLLRRVFILLEGKEKRILIFQLLHGLWSLWSYKLCHF
jgi:hypothetical protein